MHCTLKIVFLSFLMLIHSTSLSPAPSPSKAVAATALAVSTVAALASYRYLTIAQKPLITPENLHLVTFTPATEAPYRKGAIAELIPFIKNNKPFTSQYLIKDMPYTIHSGLPTVDEVINNTIFIYSGGWIGGTGSSRGNKYRCAGAGSILAQRALATGFINGTVVTFDWPSDPRAAVNFGQEDDLACLTLVYDSVSKAYPDAQIILAGDSMGGAKILNFITHPSTQSYFKNLKAIILESPRLA